MSFVDRYCMGYHCLRETVAWPARNGDILVIKCKLLGDIVINDKTRG